jgi:hypothetical protein
MLLRARGRACAHLPVCASACVCVCVRECVSERVRERESVCVCVCVCVCACVHRRMRCRSVTCPAGRHVSGRVLRAAQEGVDRGGRQREDVRRVGRRVVAQQGACRGTVATSCGVVLLRSSQAVRLAVPLSAAALVAGRGRSRRSGGPVPDGRLGRARCCHCGVPVMRTYITAADAPRYRLCTCRTTSRSSSIAPRAAWTRHARWCSLLVRRGSSFHLRHRRHTLHCVGYIAN